MLDDLLDRAQDCSGRMNLFLHTDWIWISRFFIRFWLLFTFLGLPVLMAILFQHGRRSSDVLLRPSKDFRTSNANSACSKAYSTDLMEDDTNSKRNSTRISGEGMYWFLDFIYYLYKHIYICTYLFIYMYIYQYSVAIHVASILDHGIMSIQYGHWGKVSVCDLSSQKVVSICCCPSLFLDCPTKHLASAQETANDGLANPESKAAAKCHSNRQSHTQNLCFFRNKNWLSLSLIVLLSSHFIR